MEELKEVWRKVKLLDYYEVTNGLSKNKSEFGFGYPFLTFKEVFNNYFLPENLVNLANSTAKEREKCSIKRGDIFITRTSETMEELGITAVALKDYPNATFNGFTKRLRPKSHAEISPEFISFYLKSKEFRNQIQSFSSLTTRASLNNEMLEKLELIIPDIQKQKEIAKILKNLYDKIRINNEMNKTLEEMAQTLFKRWFIDFDFPNENGEPYRSSGGKMVDSELGEIPKGWVVTKIENVVNIKRGASPRPIQDFISDNGIPWIKISDATSSISKFLNKTNEFIIEKGKEKSRFIERGTLILSNSATPGIPMIVNLDTCIHDGWLIFNEYKNITKEFLYYMLKYHKENILALSNGSVFRNLKTDILKNYKIILPNLDLIILFNRNLETIDKHIRNNVEEIQSLTEMRDILLPKLMSGEVEV